MRAIFTLLFSIWAFASNAQTCNTPVPWYTNYGTFAIGDTPILGPLCNQFQDSGVNIVTLQSAVTTLQSQLAALTTLVNSINAPVLLNTLTASNSSTLSDTTSLTSTYNIYDIVFENLIPVTTAANLSLQVHSGGTFQTTSYINGVLGYQPAGSAVGGVTTAINLTEAALVANTANVGFSGNIRVLQPSSTTVVKHWFGIASTVQAGPTALETAFGGFWNGGTGAVDGFQVSFSTGNISSGVIRIYGIK